ncbi:cache domain-containing protein, partial [Helicobacter sp. 13S00401-1]|uniref:cache domain-containing protein n=1 Tax=Helicobacter sp. 13S00401-1 TaxID=1905758 RepID=UPI0015578AAB
MRVKLMAFMSFIFLVFIIVFVIFFFNNKHQITLFESGFTNTYYANTDKMLQTTATSMAVSLGDLIDGLDEKEQIQIIDKAIANIRLGDDKSSYFFAAKGTVLLMHPDHTLIGKDAKDIKDPNGVYVYRTQHQAALNGGGTVRYMWPKYKTDGSSVDTPKMSYAILVPHTNDIWISYGVYTDDLSHHLSTLMDPIKSKMLYSFWTNLIITFIILLVCSL